jgi:uroporphyrinogen decarboxylase
MTSKEIVRRAIDFRYPPRIPLLYCNRDFEESDVLGGGAAGDPRFVPSQPGMTEWGYAWQSLDQTMGQPHVRPLEDWANIESYVPPDAYAPGRMDHLPAWIEASSYKYLVFGVGISGFNCATFLRGFEEFLMDLRLYPDRAARVLDLVFGFENALIDQLAGLPLDCVKFGDDWGTQGGLIIHPDLWRQVFKPRYAEQFARIHDQGKKVWLHTCGNVWDVIGDWIEIGLDVIELLQPDVFGIERLAAEFGGKVCFCCSVDHQRLAVEGSREEIFAYVARLRDNLGAFHGGFIGYIEDYRSLGMSEQNYQWIREAFRGA